DILPAGNQPSVIFRLVNKDRQRSTRLASILKDKLSTVYPDITLEKQYQQKVGTYKIKFKKEHMLQLGITEQQVISYLESLTHGSFVTDWVRQDENVEIKLTGADRTIFHPSNIRLNMNGLNIPLTYVASIERGSQPEQF